jgi:hypothetical protein
MDSISVGLVFTIIGGIIGYATFYMNSKRNTKQETKEEVATTTKIDTKLDIISKNVDEIRLDNKDISKSLQSLAERVSAVESSTKSAHHRLDIIEDSMRK